MPKEVLDDIGGSEFADEFKSDSKSDDNNNNDGAKPTKLEGSELVRKVQEYFFGDDALAKKFEGFVKKRAHIIDLSSDEYKLEYTEMFEEYKALFEFEIEGYMNNVLNVSVEEFYEALKSESDKDENGNEAMFGQIMAAIAGFDVFMQMMREAAEGIEEGTESAIIDGSGDIAVAPAPHK